MSETNEERDEGAVEYGSAESLDEIGERLAEPTPADFSKVVLDGAEVPEAFRGKSVADLVTQLSRLGEALKVSEDARVALKNSSEALSEVRRPQSPTSPQAPAPEPELNEDQLQALYDENPRKYQDYLAQQAEKRMMAAVRGAIGPVVTSSADMALREARQRFPDEFSAFGKEVEKFISEIPDRSVLTAPGAVDQLMDYMRGKHWQAFQAHLANKQGTLDTARRTLSEQTPTDFSRISQSSPAVVRRNGKPIQLDDTMKEIARVLGVTEEDYAKSLTDRDLRMIRSYGNR